MKDFFPFGAQYFRPPTPFREQWARDIKNMSSLGMNIARAWVCWNWVNPAPGKYEFDDYDRFIDLLKKNKMKAIMLISLESTPQWVVDKHSDALYTSHSGYKQYPEGFANTPAGGFPGLCLDNEKYKKEAAEFIKTLVQRYKSVDNIFTWEPHNEPIIEPCRRKFSNEDVYCYCDSSIAVFRKWLKTKYKNNIKNLNTRWHRKYTSFDEIHPPRMQPGNNPSDFVEWRVFWMENLASQLKWRAAQVKNADPKAKIMMHTRAYSCVQGNTATWGMDDWRLGQQVEVYGGSMFYRGYPDEAYFLNNEAIASAAQGRPWFLAEVQGGPPNTVGDTSAFHDSYSADRLAQWTWLPISQGSKGFMYWQYRMELAPPEYGYGLTNLDGSMNNRTNTTKFISKKIFDNKEFFLKSKTPEPQVAFGYAPENTVLEFLDAGEAYRNYDQLMGLYKTLLYSDLSTEIVRLDKGVFDVDFSKYKMIAISGARWIAREKADQLEEYVKNGGTLVSDIGFEYDENFYWAQQIPAHDLDKIFGCAREEVGNLDKGQLETATWQGRKISAIHRRERVGLTTGTALASWDSDLTPAIVVNKYGKGKTYYLAGEFFMNYYANEDPGIYDFIRNEVTTDIYRPVTTINSKIIPRVLSYKNTWMVFVFNTDNIDLRSLVTIDFDGSNVENFITGKMAVFENLDGKVVIQTKVPAKGCQIFKIEK